ncbi:TetR/AcrR family transcriptional regulator [Streptomyces phaeochromogenes]
MSRSERLRIETTAEIKKIALELLTSGGPGAITLRAIAREIGMTPNAIYGYFATRDDLVTTLISDVFTSLADTLDAATAAVASTAPGGRMQAWGHAYRTWALANPEGFRLIYGDAVPGYLAPDGGAAPDAQLRVCIGLTALTAAAWPQAAHLHADSAFEWSDFDELFLDPVRPAFPDLPAAGLALALRIWGRLHGLVTLEIYGQLPAQAMNMDKLFREELTQVVRSLGIEPQN